MLRRTLRRLGLLRGSPPVELVLYSRPGCHLCEDMKAELDRARVRPAFRLREVNIESDPELLARHERSIPVLEIAGRTAFKGRLTRADFERKYRRIVGEAAP